MSKNQEIQCIRERVRTMQAFAREVTKELRDVTKAAAKEAEKLGMGLMPLEVIAAYEELASAVEACHDGIAMTRDYKDAQQDQGVTYNGKRWLIDRHAGGAVYQAMDNLKRALK